jgi:hypothetical protein
MYLTTEPIGGFIGTGFANQYQASTSLHHNVSATAYFNPGTKVRYYNATLKGWGVCIYAKYSKGAETLAAGYLMGIDSANAPGTYGYHSITGDVSTFGTSGRSGGLYAVALSAMTDTYWGWFWCGGIVPDFYTSATAKIGDSDFLTDGNIIAGAAVAPHLSTDATMILAIDTNATASNPHMGFAYADDSSTALGMDMVSLVDRWG